MMTDAAIATDLPAARTRGLLKTFLARPETGSILGAIIIIVFFSLTAPTFLRVSSVATMLYSSSVIGIMAVPVALLMIGGEFDLSAGVAVTSSGLFASIFSWWFSTNLWIGILLALVFSVGIGFLNGFLLVKTKLHSFIVTLGTFFMLEGLNLGVTHLVTGGVSSPAISDMAGFRSASRVFAAQWTIGGAEIWVTVFIWIALILIATWILLRTRQGNWIFASGGDAAAARAVGVPVVKTKIALYMGVGFCAWLIGMHLLFAYNSVQSGDGVGNEFFYIIAAVIGGCLLDGGYGSAIGGAIGALIYGVTSNGIVYAGWDPDWFQFFLGAVLLLATIINFTVKRRAEAAR